MSLAGQGVVAIWNDITPEGRAEFFAWHNREHMPERVGIPGFRRGRRYIALAGAPEFFTLYETDSPEVLAGSDYLNRLNHPTPWTRRARRSSASCSPTASCPSSPTSRASAASISASPIATPASSKPRRKRGGR